MSLLNIKCLQRKSNANMPFMADLDDMKMLSSPQDRTGSHNRLRLERGFRKFVTELHPRFTDVRSEIKLTDTELHCIRIQMQGNIISHLCIVGKIFHQAGV